MKNYEQYKRIVRFISIVILLSVEMGIYWYIWLHYYNPKMDTPYYRTGHWLMVVVYGILLLLFNRMYGGLKVGYLKTFDAIYSQILANVCANGMIYLQITLLTKSFQSLLPLIFMTVLDFVIVCAWSFIFNGIYHKIYPPRDILLIYGDRPVKSLMGKLHTRTDRFVVGDIAHISEGYINLTAKINLHEGVIIFDVPSHLRNQILKYCYGKSIRTYTVLKISDILIRSSESWHLIDTPLIMSRNNGLLFEQLFFKRCLDILLASIGICLVFPIMLLIIISIKLDDQGPVFYGQKRLSKNGKVFCIFKFRSMKIDAEKDGIARLAKEKDDRITRVGRVIRIVRLDEIPQLFNILKGDMSIVGPRPERPEIMKKYIEDMPEFSYRLRVKAGLTGYAQVYGKYNTKAYDKLKLDLMYIQNYSMLLDIKIIFKTLKILFIKDKTEGFKKI